ncbi:hypothetical protein TNIN_63301 [Trichonephila inaurata madagascariensis]|uniref:Uncharacterized protein n=1 Tax=Trichonephila inaurata madagascariensis TaxID=2747483 RepID=A0A8X7BZ05_9ARAC|nr:hypothetical protein TNIN_63301 [Trichonephila inaurata madagascariensis]
MYYDCDFGKLRILSSRRSALQHLSDWSSANQRFYSAQTEEDLSDPRCPPPMWIPLHVNIRGKLEPLEECVFFTLKKSRDSLQLSHSKHKKKQTPRIEEKRGQSIKQKQKSFYEKRNSSRFRSDESRTITSKLLSPQTGNSGRRFRLLVERCASQNSYCLVRFLSVAMRPFIIKVPLCRSGNSGIKNPDGNTGGGNRIASRSSATNYGLKIKSFQLGLFAGFRKNNSISGWILDNILRSVKWKNKQQLWREMVEVGNGCVRLHWSLKINTLFGIYIKIKQLIFQRENRSVGFYAHLDLSER